MRRISTYRLLSKSKSNQTICIARPQRRMIHRALLWLFLSCMALLVVKMSIAADDGDDTVKVKIKAAYLFKFAGYIDWPTGSFSDSSSPVMIGVIGDDEVEAELNNLKIGHTINNRPVEIKHIRPVEPVVGVQILFVGHQVNEKLKRLLSPIQSQPILSVTESATGLDDGSDINFVTVDNHLRFEVAVAHAERSGLKISAKLLAVAQRVDTGKP